MKLLWVGILLASSTLAIAMPAEPAELAQNALPFATPGGRASAPRAAIRNAQSPASRAAQAQPAQPPAKGPAPPPAPVPIRTEINRFDNWVVTCNEFAEGPKKKICSAQIQVMQQGTNQVVLTWTVFVNDSKQFITALQTPTGVSISPGVELQLEKAGKRKLNFDTSDNGRCTASTTKDNTKIREVSAAPSAQVSITAINGSTVQFNLPIKGFDKAYAQLRTAL